jgi:WD40 repeat protein
MVWTNDDKILIASSCYYQGKNFRYTGDVKLWDVATGKERSTLPGPFGQILGIAMSPDGKTVALLDSAELRAESKLNLVNVETGKRHVLPSQPGYTFHSLHFTPKGKPLVTGIANDSVRVWEASLPTKDAKP